MNRFKRSALLAALFLLAFSFSGILPAVALERQTAVVREVLTGDTVRLVGGKTLRYVGVQAPALQSIIPLVREYGNNSLQFNKELVEGKTISIEWGSQLRDSRGQLLGYVFLEDGTFVNDQILKNGHGRMLYIPPNLKYQAAFRKSELEARRAKKGLWREEPENPFIKSEYIGDKVTKVFYFPTSPELDRVPQSQIVTFNSRVAAKAAGFKPCSTCREESDKDSEY
jgi:micrococcal nuclease